MPIVRIDKDLENVTLTITAEFSVPVRRLWDAYADPRQLERFWGPPQWPATFTRHDFAPEGVSNYHMTGPDGETSGGYWRFIAVDVPHSFEVVDGFTAPDGTPNDELPTMRMVFEFEAIATGSRMVTTTHFDSLEDLENLLAMGMLEGTRAAMGQIDDVLAEPSSPDQESTRAQILGETRVRVSRIIHGELHQVWRAHHEPRLIQQWLLGPDGWIMPTCEPSEDVGDSFVFEWESSDGAQRFGFTGQLLESMPPHREVTTEQMIGSDGPATLNEMTLTPMEDGTLVSIVITYPDATVRDAVLDTGMTDGMEASYRRLEQTVLPKM